MVVAVQYRGSVVYIGEVTIRIRRVQSMLRCQKLGFFFLLISVSFAQLRAQDKPARKSLKLAGMFANHMVLQQQTDAAIWGKAKPDAEVRIKASWSDQVTKTRSNENGEWKTRIKTPAAGGPFRIRIDSGNESKTLKDVLCGEVWICSGQSNMQWKLRGFGEKHFKEDVDKANHPKIRFCQVQQKIALQPQSDLKTKWSVCTPQTALQFSAVGYFFGDKLREELDVPIGLISTNWGGSSAEAWVDEKELLRELPEFGNMLNGYDELIKKHGVSHTRGKKLPKGLNQRMPSVLYNNMIHPLIPYSVRGVIWYQGESNVGHPIQYRKLFPKLIESWRREWGQGDFPFYFVQIAPYHYRTNELPAALLREAQLQTLNVPNTGMAVLMDVGDSTNIHPKKKKPVGQRLALLALAKDYGKTDLVYSGPEYVGHEVESKQIRLKFKHIGGGLATRDGKELSHFMIAGSDEVFHSAVAKIDGETILVGSAKVDRPVAVRYGWGNSDEPNLMNKEGLPSSSFRTDEWEILPVKPAKKPSKKRAKKNKKPAKKAKAG